MHRQAKFWAITSYFNPVGYRQRLENYRLFRDRLLVPLVTVELSHTGDYHLRRGDADILIQRTCPDVLWHKERLLNIALRALPPECETVAWLDCDLVFESDDWPERTSRLLETHTLVAPFRNAYFLSRGEQPGGVPSKQAEWYSLLYALETGIASPEILRGNMQFVQRICGGLAGAARRRFLENHGFYDACVLGSGDRAFICAALGRFDEAMRWLQMGPGWARHYMAWAQPFFEAVRGNVTYLDENIFHVWHGELENRRYAARHALLHNAGFDPSADLIGDESGCWRWHPARSGLQEEIRRYFESRREDG